jgi:hypothetical protein
LRFLNSILIRLLVNSNPSGFHVFALEQKWSNKNVMCSSFLKNGIELFSSFWYSFNCVRRLLALSLKLFKKERPEGEVKEAIALIILLMFCFISKTLFGFRSLSSASILEVSVLISFLFSLTLSINVSTNSFSSMLGYFYAMQI